MLEVDRGTEASGTIRAKVARHLSYYRTGQETIHPRVLWSVPDTRRAAQIVEVIQRLSPLDRQMFSVCLQGEVVESLAEEARS